MLRFTLAVLVALCAAGVVDEATAQSARRDTDHDVRITGNVQTPDGSRLPGATVRVFGTPLITTTNGDGAYTLAFTRTTGRLILFAELSSFQSDDATLQVAGPLSTRIDFTLTPSFASDVTVIAEVPMLDTSDNVSRIALAPEQVSVLPSLGERDLFRAFQLLPGVSGSNEASSGLYVRGGTPDQNRIEYDGFRVYHVDHLFGYFSAFNMDAVDTVELSKGGFEAQHGGALSSVMQIAGKSGRLDRTAGSVGMGLLSFNGVFETPLFNNKGSGLVAVRRSFQSPLYDKILNLYDNNPTIGRPGGSGGGPGGGGRFSTFSSQPSSSFYDVNGKLLFNPSAADSVSVSLYRGNDNLDNSRPGRFSSRRDSSNGSSRAASTRRSAGSIRTAPSTSATCAIPAIPGLDSSGRGSGGRTCSARSRSAIRASKTSAIEAGRSARTPLRRPRAIWWTTSRSEQRCRSRSASATRSRAAWR